MSESSAPPRPRQTTVSGALIIGGSLFVVATVFERVAGLNSLETREAVQRFLAEPPGDGLGLTVQGLLDTMRVLAMVAGACAVATAILGYQVFQRSRSARVALSVLALPLFVTGLAAGGFMSSVVAVAIVMLWLQPSRDWFAGITRPQAEATTRAVPPPGPAAAPESPAQPRPYAGFGQPAAQPPTAQPTTAQPTTAPSAWPTQPPPATARPAAVLWAAVLTWVCAGLAVVGMGLSVLVLLASPDLVFDELHKQNPDLAEQGLTESMIQTATYATAAVVIVWSLVAIVVAGLAFRGLGWARLALLASATLSALFSLVGVVSSPLFAVPLAASVATVVLLLRPDVRAWFNDEGRAGRRAPDVGGRR